MRTKTITRPAEERVVRRGHSDLIAFDSESGLETWVDHDPDNPGKFRLRHTQEVADILDNNTQLANDTDRSKRGIKNSLWHVGTIPDVVWMKWRHEEGIDIFNPQHTKAIMRKLQDVEFKRLKTTQGRII